MGPGISIKVLYSDNHSSLKAACNAMGILRRQAQPGDPQSNGVIEGLNHRILQGTRANLIQAGLPNCFWPFASQHWCFLRNVHPRGDNEPSPYFLKHGVDFEGMRIPFGAGVYYYPSPTKYKHQSKFEGRLHYGVFLGYVLDPCCEWTDMQAVADLTDFANCSLF